MLHRIVLILIYSYQPIQKHRKCHFESDQSSVQWSTPSLAEPKPNISDILKTPTRKTLDNLLMVFFFATPRHEDLSLKNILSEVTESMLFSTFPFKKPLSDSHSFY